jgi:hypothetical protein
MEISPSRDMMPEPPKETLVSLEIRRKQHRKLKSHRPRVDLAEETLFRYAARGGAV